MTHNFEKFKNLHQSDELLILPNVWNVKSALLFQELELPAIATSSMAVSNSLGYDDGEAMPFSDYLFVIKRILSSVEIPLSVDMEMGYGNTGEKIVDNLLRLSELGVAGINIEDSAVARSARTLKDASMFAKTIAHIKNKLAINGAHLFINVRCDAYLLDVKNKQQESLRRLKLYETAGANGIFLPGICDEKDITATVNHTKLPLNVMCIPGLPGFDKLQTLGVKRVSLGPFMFNKVYSNITNLSKAILKDKSFAAIVY